MPDSGEPFALLVLAGEAPRTELLRSLASEAELIVCADSAAAHVAECGLSADVIIGDLDSISQETLQLQEQEGSTIFRVSEQESNDFEKALCYLLERGARHVRIVGHSGGRLDHTLTNISVLARYADRFALCIAHDDFGEHFVLTESSGTREFGEAPGTLISLTPIPHARLTIVNFRYPLQDEILELGVREGLSNVIERTPAMVTVHSGSVLVSVNRQSSTL